MLMTNAGSLWLCSYELEKIEVVINGEIRVIDVSISDQDSKKNSAWIFNFLIPQLLTEKINIKKQFRSKRFFE